MSENVYRIKDWGMVFRLAETDRHDEVTWGKFPVARNSTSYRTLMGTAAGRTAYCVFIGFFRLVTRGKTKGRCVVKGRAISADDIRTETGIPLRDVAPAIAMLASKEIGWLVPDVPETADARSETGPETASGRSETSIDKSREDQRREDKAQASASVPRPVIEIEPCALESGRDAGSARNGEARFAAASPEASRPRLSGPADASVARRLLAEAEFVFGNKRKFPPKLRNDLAEKPGFTAARVFTLLRRAADERPRDPVGWVTAGITEAYAIDENDQRLYGEWARGQYGSLAGGAV